MAHRQELPEGSTVAVVGGGPCGLAAAIALKGAGLAPLVFDKGAVCASILEFPTFMTFFSTSEKLAIGGIPFVTAGDKPSRRDALAYYRSLVPHFGLEVRQYEHVESITRGASGFEIVSRPRGGESRTTLAQAVVVATGCFGVPNLLGVPGEDQPHVSHWYREGHVAFQRHAVVVGGASSAAEAALDLFRSGAHVTLVHRGPEPYHNLKPWVKTDLVNRIASGEIATRFQAYVRSIGVAHVHLDTPRGPENLAAEHVFVCTGFRADTTLLQALGVSLDAKTGIPAHDHRTMETPVPGVYIAGVISAGFNANRVFIENGRDHGALIAEALTAGS